MFPSFGALLYAGVGFFVASTNMYLAVSGLATLLSALLAIVLWPLVLLGVDLHVTLI
ncbi:MAG: hypothetical protein ACT4OM_06945 [Actinomycetota bacterium]